MIMENRKYDAVIFDLDGTLLNTLGDLTAGVNYAMDQFGFPHRTIDEVERFIGNGVKVLIDLSVPAGTDEKTAADCLSVYKEYYSTHLDVSTKPYEGIHELLVSLKEAGMKTAVVSNKYDSATKHLAKLHFDGLLGFALGERADIKRKPAPDALFYAMEQIGAKKAIYVGDSEVDVKIARNAGMECIGVSWGFRGRARLEEEGADFIIDKPEELLPIVL